VRLGFNVTRWGMISPVSFADPLSGRIVVLENVIGGEERKESATSVSKFSWGFTMTKACNAVRPENRQKIVDRQAAIPSS
jgi:hypothetical protein